MAFLQRVWQDQQGQDVAEYAAMFAIIMIIAIATVRFIGTSAGTAFSSVASTIASQ